VIRRLFWMGIGVGLGVAATVWIIRTLRIRVLQSTPASVAADVGGQVRRLRADVRDAVDEGRLAMREREAELNERLAGVPQGPPALTSADTAPEVLPLRHRTGHRTVYRRP
jgi:hypothetical protein